MKNKFCLLVLLLCLAFAASVSTAEFTDVSSDDKYYEAVAKLSEEGIINGYDDGTFKPEATITRAEAAAIIVRAADIDISSEQSIYTDVENSFWGKDYIMSATAAGILNGMGNSKFAPEENVTYNQIIKMIVCMRGLEQDAISRGGWPTGYVRAAYEKEIIDDSFYYSIVNYKKGDQNAIRGDVAQFIYDAINIKDEYKLIVSGNEYYIGMDAGELEKAEEIKPSVYGFDWYIYGTETYRDFFAAGIAEGKVVALASAGEGFNYSGYECGDYEDEDSPYNSYLYTDKNDSNIVHGVYIISDSYRYATALNEDALYGESRMNFHCVNAFRTYHGEGLLKWSESAAAAAQLHSQDMADNNYFSHDSIDGRVFSERLSNQGIRWMRCGENISAGSPCGFKSYDGWVNSAGHRSNMLGDFEYLGVGAGYNKDSTYDFYFTQDFH